MRRYSATQSELPPFGGCAARAFRRHGPRRRTSRPRAAHRDPPRAAPRCRRRRSAVGCELMPWTMTCAPPTASKGCAVSWTPSSRTYPPKCSSRCACAPQRPMLTLFSLLTDWSARSGAALPARGGAAAQWRTVPRLWRRGARRHAARPGRWSPKRAGSTRSSAACTRAGCCCCGGGGGAGAGPGPAGTLSAAPVPPPGAGATGESPASCCRWKRSFATCPGSI